MNEKSLSWRDSLLAYKSSSVVSMLFLGFSAGLPYLLIFSTLSAWLNDEGLNKSTIGYFSWVGLLFSIKFFWAPVVDRRSLPWLSRVFGQRRAWMLLAQFGIVLCLCGMAIINPVTQLSSLAYLAIGVALFSATQDICIDAYRIESVADELQATMASTYIFGYRLALLVAGAGAFYIADWYSWSSAYFSMAALMGIGIVTTLLVTEPERKESLATDKLEKDMIALADKVPDIPYLLPRSRAVWIMASVVSPFVEFFKRNGSFAITILVFIAIFRISDITMGVMANPFYLDLGYTKSEIASVAKVFGFFMTIAGSIAGGVLVAKYGIFRLLIWSAILVSITNLFFASIANQAPDLSLLAMVISADNLSGGLSNVVFIAYLSSLTNQHYTATQYALFSSLMTLPGKFIGGFSGVVVESSGYEVFFVYAAAIGVPAILLAIYLMYRDSGLRAR